MREAETALRPLLEDPEKQITEAVLIAEIQAERDAETTPMRIQTERRTQETMDKVAALYHRTKQVKTQINRLKRLADGEDEVNSDEEMVGASRLEYVMDLEGKEKELRELEKKLSSHRAALGSQYAAVEKLVASKWTQLRIRLLAKKQILRVKLRERKAHYRQVDRTSHLAGNPANQRNSARSRKYFPYLLCYRDLT